MKTTTTKTATATIAQLATAGITIESVRTLKGKAVNDAYLLVFGKSTANKNTTLLREQIIAAINSLSVTEICSEGMGEPAHIDEEAAPATECAKAGADAGDEEATDAEPTPAESAASNIASAADLPGDEAAHVAAPAPVLAAPKAKRERKAAKAAPAPKARDARLPPVGTVMKHMVRGVVQAECVENEAGEFIYAGTAYPSIHKAAFAAQQALGLKNSGANGFRFFDLDERAPTERKPGVKVATNALAKAWDRYRGEVETALKDVSPDAKAAAIATLGEHATVMLGYMGDAPVAA